MGSRTDLHHELLNFSDNVYFQPPSNINMSYPCIIYNKTGKYRSFGNDTIYLSKQEYRITVIDRDPDSSTADEIESYFSHCSISQYYRVDSLNHTILTLYY